MSWHNQRIFPLSWPSTCRHPHNPTWYHHRTTRDLPSTATRSAASLRAQRWNTHGSTRWIKVIRGRNGWLRADWPVAISGLCNLHSSRNHLTTLMAGRECLDVTWGEVSILLLNSRRFIVPKLRAFTPQMGWHRAKSIPVIAVWMLRPLAIQKPHDSNKGVHQAQTHVSVVSIEKYSEKMNCQFVKELYPPNRMMMLPSSCGDMRRWVAHSSCPTSCSAS